MSEQRKPREFWINESLNEFGDRNKFVYQVFEIENEAVAAKAQAFPKAVCTIHVREIIEPGSNG